MRTTEDVNIKDRVKESFPGDVNQNMDIKVLNRMHRYRNHTIGEINQRLEKIRHEWDMDRTLEVNASSLAFAGIVMGIFSGKKWFFLPFIAAGFLLQYGIQGWCPPVPLFRKLGVRTRQEIDEEIYALKALRGDFDNIKTTSEPEEILETFRK